jgi:hypothetical protein
MSVCSRQANVSILFVCSVHLSLSIMTLGIMTLGIMTIGIMSVCPWQAKNIAKNILKGKYAKKILKGKYFVCLFCSSVSQHNDNRHNDTKHNVCLFLAG